MKVTPTIKLNKVWYSPPIFTAGLRSKIVTVTVRFEILYQWLCKSHTGIEHDSLQPWMGDSIQQTSIESATRCIVLHSDESFSVVHFFGAAAKEADVPRLFDTRAEHPDRCGRSVVITICAGN